MTKSKTMVLMLCLILSGALSYAHGAARTESHEDGRPIELIESTGVTGPDRSSSIFPTIDGHILIVMFTENLGQVAIEVTTSTGGPVDGTSTITPTGIQIYIPNTGDYIVTFTLPNGDEYYGEFTVTE